LKLAVRVLPVFGRDPGRLGRNGDIDLRSLTEVDFPVHAVINTRGEGQRRKELASACHKSQLAGGPGGGGLLGAVMRLTQGPEIFMRAYPPVPNGRLRERDLFAGL
jgi:N-acetyl-1-D-myo-inositol-2-amino-2-deoxy-alpha-D-glucopyranoside deacetylase/mycothiol S-conjugate amidase